MPSEIKKLSMNMKHSRSTLMLHAVVALVIIVQLMSTFFMEDPEKGTISYTMFQIHQNIGLLSFVVIVFFCIAVLVRSKGTDIRMLVPWLSAQHRTAFWQDMKLQYESLRKLEVPAYQDHSPFASAVHGLGLLLMLAMAGTGCIYYFLGTGLQEHETGLAGLAIFAHGALGGLAWAYLLGHAALSVLHHYLQELNLREMW